MRAIRFVLSACLLLACAASQAQDPATPADALRRMEQAVSAGAFSGVVVYSREGQLDALRVSRAGAGQGEQIERLTGPSLPLQRDQDRVWFSGGAAYPPFIPKTQIEGPDRTLGYELRFVAEDRVAGRMTQVIDAQPRDAQRYGRRFWIDQETGVLLRAAVFSADGQLVEQWMFAEFQPVAAEAGANAVQQPTLTTPAGVDQGVASASVGVEGAPDGFILMSVVRSAAGEQLLYSDGLAKVSVFVEKLPAQNAVLSGLQRRGALSVFGRLFRGYQVVVVGEVPPATAERFAQGLIARDDG